MVTNAYTPRIGGITGYISTLVKGLEVHGFECEILCMPEPFNRLDEKNRTRRIWWRSIHLLFAGAFATWSLFRIARRCVSGSRPIVHSHSASYCLLVAVLARVLGCKALHTFHSPIGSGTRLLRLFAKRLDTVVFVSRSMLADYDSVGLRGRVNVVIPGAVDLNLFHPSVPGERRDPRKFVRSYLGKDPEGALVLFVGRIVPEKGVDVLIAATAEVLREGVELCTLVVGPFDESPRGIEYAEFCRALSSASPIREHVILTGPVPTSELPDLYRASSVFVCPSVWAEPATLVVPEALACGTPVVVSKTGGLPERVIDDVDGLIVPPGDPHALAAALTRLLRDPNLRERLSSAAAKKAAREFGAEMMVRRYVELYFGIQDSSQEASRRGS
jgi:glycosyltransferase involved in cell wall biosynthesis